MFQLFHGCRYAGKKAVIVKVCHSMTFGPSIFLSCLSVALPCVTTLRFNHVLSLQNHDDGDKNTGRAYGHALVVGLSKEPRKVHMPFETTHISLG